MTTRVISRLSKNAISGIFCHFLRFQKGARCIMTSSSTLDKAMETLEKNPYYEKYQKRISEIRQDSPDELVTRWEEYQKNKKRESQISSKSSQISSLSNPKREVDLAASSTSAHQRVLNDIMKVDLIKDKTKEEIEKIWTQYFINKDGIAGVVPKDAYLNIRHKSKTHPIAFKENAPECLMMVYYEELMEEKGVVLLRGEFDKNILDSKEATCLANQIQLYYGENNEKRDNLLTRFTNSPEDFKHMDLIAELECLTL
ncbi:ATP synthase mitochondrial F1 complex assembly factor 1 isoform X2 [Hetaerina americana]|uniref:ATP synthase mitochondrial F1 complex assembly factor 1 isoform X2 n=1 Tax=Hetaerina americana TaxID=62018 RepID=UPI003A7F2DEE